MFVWFFLDFCQESDLEVSTEASKAGDDFIVTLFNLLSCLNNAPKALTQALQPYLERAHIWEHLYTLAGKVAAVYCVTLWYKDHCYTLTCIYHFLRR